MAPDTLYPKPHPLGSGVDLVHPIIMQVSYASSSAIAGLTYGIFPAPTPCALFFVPMGCFISNSKYLFASDSFVTEGRSSVHKTTPLLLPHKEQKSSETVYIQVIPDGHVDARFGGGELKLPGAAQKKYPD